MEGLNIDQILIKPHLATIILCAYLIVELNMFSKAFIITMITSLVEGTFLNTSQSLENHRVASSLGFATVRALD